MSRLEIGGKCKGFGVGIEALSEIDLMGEYGVEV